MKEWIISNGNRQTGAVLQTDFFFSYDNMQRKETI